MPFQRLTLALCAFAPLALVSAQTPATPPAPHPITLNDLFRFHDVGSPEVSPDGQWVSYTVSTVDEKLDKRITDLWMVSWDHKQNVRLTWKGDVSEDVDPEDVDSSSSPRWSPDGQYISFTVDR